MGAGGRARGRFIGPAPIGAECSARRTEPLAGVSAANRSDFIRLLGRNRPELPDNFTLPAVNPMGGRRFRPFFMMANMPQPHFDSNLMERLIRTWSQDLSAKKTPLSPRSFLAVVRQNPGVQHGS